MEEPGSPQYSVLGVRVDALQTSDVISRMRRWIEAGERGRFIAVTGMHGVSVARRSTEFKSVLQAADLVVADGMPLVWIGRSRGHRMRRRVYGPELLLEFCERTAAEGYRHYFYGGASGVAERLAERLRQRFPGLTVAGTLSPPFRPLSEKERLEIHRRINLSRPDVVWIGLGTPKQERWMYENRLFLDVPVLIGVGAAFDFHTERVRQSPVWMRESGLEWLWRLSQEPRRLWKRYLIEGPIFAWHISLETLGLKRYD